MTTWREAIKPGEAESAGIDRGIVWKRWPRSFHEMRRLEDGALWENIRKSDVHS